MRALHSCVSRSRPAAFLTTKPAILRVFYFGTDTERGTFLSRDNFLRRNIQKKLENVGLGWVNFQVLRRTQASLGHKEQLDPKVAADQRGHAIGVALDTYTESDLESRLEAVTKLERALAGGKQAEQAAKQESSSELGYRGKRGKIG